MTNGQRAVFGLAGVGLLVAIFGMSALRHETASASPAPAGAAAVAAPDPAAAPATSSSGRGVTVTFSDKPVPLPALPLKDVAGKPVPADAWRGKVVLVNFWATWCAPCRAEIPELTALASRYPDQLEILGLSIDEQPASAVRTFANGLGINYPVAMADASLQQAFGGIPAVPSTFVVNREGKIVQRHVGILDPTVTEQEVRVLAGLPTDAQVQYVKDTGQVLLANAAFATEIPGVDLSKLTPGQKAEVLKRLNTEHCTCGCGLTLAQCRINDPGCDVSLPAAQKIVQEVLHGK
jgi:thiol-disulfide isomerase/thioredoxin